MNEILSNVTKLNLNHTINASMHMTIILMQAHLPGLSHVLLAIDQHCDLFADFSESTQHFLVTVHESQDRVRNAGFLAEFSNQTLNLAEVVSRHTGEQVVDGLELQSAVHEVHPGRAVNIHGSPQLSLRE